MGGGDLNSKKSWHPNTMKNQERVWKAEQAAAEEKKRIIELQRERAEERDRAELNEMARRNVGSSNDNRLNWMYDKPDKKGQDEDYLLGKSIEKNYGPSEKDEQDVIPAVARRVVGSSMLTSSGDGQVDLARKIREDPLLLVKERERAARAALLNNPLQRRRLAELLRKEQEQKKEKEKKKTKKKGNIDDELAAKLTALGGEKNIDIAKLLDSEDSSSNSEVNKKKKKKKKKKEEKVKKLKKKKKKRDRDSDTEESLSDEKGVIKNRKRVSKDRHDYNKSELKKDKEESEVTNHDNRSSRKRRRESSHEDYTRSRQRDTGDERNRRRLTPDNRKSLNDDQKRKIGLSEKEKAAKLAEMASAGAAREVERGRRVAEQRRDESAAAALPAGARAHHARAMPSSLEARIHSNRHYIQRDRQHMNEHFARR